jgi:hypothetical protein
VEAASLVASILQCGSGGITLLSSSGNTQWPGRNGWLNTYAVPSGNATATATRLARRGLRRALALQTSRRAY